MQDIWYMTPGLRTAAPGWLLLLYPRNCLYKSRLLRFPGRCFPVIYRRHVSAIVPILWPLPSVCSLFLNTPWAFRCSGYRCIMYRCCRSINWGHTPTPQSVVFCTLTCCSFPSRSLSATNRSCFDEGGFVSIRDHIQIAGRHCSSLGKRQ